MKSLYDQGLLSDKPMTVKGCKVVPWEVIASSLPNPPTLEELKHKLKSGVIADSHALVVVEVIGEKDGQKETHVLWVPDPSIRDVVKTYPMATNTSYMTGTNGALLTRMLGRGDVKTRGVITPELLEQKVRYKYLEELAKQEPSIKAFERVEKPLN
jgi:saccharopine dehydrogenase-like NADP-dependent oxidoreductase